MTRHFLSDDDLSAGEQAEILDLADQLAEEPFLRTPFRGPQTVAVLFDKASTRTRISFEAGIAELGGHPMIMDSALSHLGRGEPIPIPPEFSAGTSPPSCGERRVRSGWSRWPSTPGCR